MANNTYHILGSDPIHFNNLLDDMKQQGFSFSASLFSDDIDPCCKVKRRRISVWCKRGSAGRRYSTIYRYFAVCPKCNMAVEVERQVEDGDKTGIDHVDATDLLFPKGLE